MILTETLIREIWDAATNAKPLLSNFAYNATKDFFTFWEIEEKEEAPQKGRWYETIA